MRSAREVNNIKKTSLENRLVSVLKLYAKTILKSQAIGLSHHMLLALTYVTAYRKVPKVVNDPRYLEGRYLEASENLYRIWATSSQSNR